MPVSPQNAVVQVASLLENAYACRVNNLKQSIAFGEEALGISRALEDKTLIGKSLNHLSLFYMITGNFQRSAEMAEEAIVYFKELGDEKGVADGQYALAGIYYRTDNFHLGLISLLDCLSIYRKFEDYFNQARVQKSLGTIYEYFGDPKNAMRAYEESIIAGQKAGDSNLVSNAYNPLSGIYLKSGKIQEAGEIIDKSISLKTATGDIRGLAFALYGRGKVYIETGDFAQAEQDFLEAIRIHEENGDKLGIAMAYYKMGVLYLSMDELQKASDVIKTGIVFSEKYNLVMTGVKCKYLFSKLYKRLGDSSLSLIYLEEYIAGKEAVINTRTLQVIENYERINRMTTLEAEARLEREKAEILEKKELAEQTARVRQEFLSTMSHEMRTPLNAVITITSLLKPRADPEDTELLDSLKFASNNLLMIINDILDFTKLDAGKVSLDFHPSNFRLLMDNIRKTYDNLAREKGLRLLLNIEPGVADFYELDETKLSQILGNLVGNAIKYSEQGEVVINVRRLNEGQTDSIEFKVTDTGIGIAPGYLTEIFSSFFQPKSVTTRKQGGSGLGLAIVKKLVELHGSEVHVKSALEKGSEFHFTLELRRSEKPAIIPVKRSLELKDKCVLLAEDNVINAMVARKLLSNWGVITEHAKDGADAVRLSNTRVFDCILMDIHMPEMNGYDAAERIRTVPGNLNNNTPIFALTADIVAELNGNSAPHFSGFLLKPIEIDKLYEALVGC